MKPVPMTATVSSAPIRALPKIDIAQPSASPGTGLPSSAGGRWTARSAGTTSWLA